MVADAAQLQACRLYELLSCTKAPQTQWPRAHYETPALHMRQLYSRPLHPLVITHPCVIGVDLGKRWSLGPGRGPDRRRRVHFPGGEFGGELRRPGAAQVLAG